MPPNTLPSEADVRLSVPVLLFTRPGSGSRAFFRRAPAWQARANISAALKEGGRCRRRAAIAPAARARRRRVRAGADAARRRRPGHRGAAQPVPRRPGLPRRAVAHVPPAGSRPASRAREQSTTFYNDLLERIRREPGVRRGPVPQACLSWARIRHAALHRRQAAGRSVAAARRRLQHGHRPATSKRSGSA